MRYTVRFMPLDGGEMRSEELTAHSSLSALRRATMRAYGKGAYAGPPHSDVLPSDMKRISLIHDRKGAPIQGPTLIQIESHREVRVCTRPAR